MAARREYVALVVALALLAVVLVAALVLFVVLALVDGSWHCVEQRRCDWVKETAWWRMRLRR